MPLTLAGVHPLALPVGIVGVLNRQLRQADRAPLAVTGIELDQLVDHHPHRPAIGNDVVLGQDQHMLVCRHPQQLGPQQRAIAQIEGRLALAVGQGMDLGLIGQAAGVQFDDLDVQRCRWMDHLYRSAIVFGKGSAQGFMPGNQGIECMAQRVEVQFSGQAQRRGDVVGGAVGLQLPKEPLAFLGIGENRRLVGAAAADRSDTKEVDALFFKQNRQGSSFLGRKRAYRVD
ncbi:hypothetical protein PPC_4194 [Pseudomonas protegens Cab57]|nr:hypothetical protein PPC_4194 [Pseudomonas protegens Cab57]